jgi:iron(III) transport system ATP-binding protein
MGIDKYLKLAKKLNNCPNCGNEYIGNGEGSLEIREHTFSRSCKCGYSVTVDEDGKVLKESGKDGSSKTL